VLQDQDVGVEPRILSRSSSCIPFMTPRTTLRAVTPTVIPPRAIQVMKERNRPFFRDEPGTAGR
jgi:hypothetical protein